MRATFLLVVLMSVGCHAAPRPADAAHGMRVARMDSVVARRICQSPDSVIAGTKDCVLLDQGRRRLAPPAPAPRQ